MILNLRQVASLLGVTEAVIQEWQQCLARQKLSQRTKVAYFVSGNGGRPNGVFTVGSGHSKKPGSHRSQ